MNRLAPGVPGDYYDAIRAAEMTHWWQLGMRRLSATLLGERLLREGMAVLDAGCGTGGFLRFVLDTGSPGRTCGIDVSSAAIELARRRVPEAELHVAPLWEIPLEAGEFDLIVTNDVLQHLPEDRVADSLAELRRLQPRGGALLVRTNGALRLRREREDWRAYDRRTLVRALEQAGYRCGRVTHVNLIPSLWALARGNAPHAPTEERHGVATAAPSPVLSRIATGLLAAEAQYLGHTPLRLPYGHTQLALALAD
jgi:SAM-dependent methyltransferase